MADDNKNEEKELTEAEVREVAALDKLYEAAMAEGNEEATGEEGFLPSSGS